MIQAEKLSQKLHNLKSKKEIKDFFIYFDEYRQLEIQCTNGEMSSYSHPSHLAENTEGHYLIVWNDSSISKGKMNSDSINNFDDFITNARSSMLPFQKPVYIPERGIYPMVITYSKSLSDMIELPEYLFKISDITVELDKMINVPDGFSKILAREGSKHCYSSKELDEYFPYTQFTMELQLGNKLYWELSSADIFPLLRFQDLFSFVGDIYNLSSQSEKTEVDRTKPVVLSPLAFKKLFFDHIVSNLQAKTIQQNQSAFHAEDFNAKLKCLGTFSLGYDPLINHKLGTYRFSSCGVKPQRQYFVKFGKLHSMISDCLTFHEASHSMPTVEISSLSNVRFEGIRKRTFFDLQHSNESFLFCFNEKAYSRLNFHSSMFYFKNALEFNANKTKVVEQTDITVDLIDAISKGKCELIEFTDGQLGCKINP